MQWAVFRRFATTETISTISCPRYLKARFECVLMHTSCESGSACYPHGVEEVGGGERGVRPGARYAQTGVRCGNAGSPLRNSAFAHRYVAPAGSPCDIIPNAVGGSHSANPYLPSTYELTPSSPKRSNVAVNEIEPNCDIDHRAEQGSERRLCLGNRGQNSPISPGRKPIVRLDLTR
jgi:hypothetical protein